jgi:hydrogenase maturation protein HypF
LEYGLGHVRRRFLLEGTVQGVGFRPFAATLAARLSLSGWVRNTPAGVALEVEGAPGSVDDFARRLRDDAPALVRYHRFEAEGVEPCGDSGFSIKGSDTSGAASGWILPDLGTCTRCEAEFLDPSDRRFLYPFLSCTRCGPRYSIMEGLPYDRERTAMRRFPLCEACRAEYENLSDNRFHAETTACRRCGPKVWFEGGDGEPSGRDALRQAADLVRSGGIVAVLGLGGFLLVCDATDSPAVRELRRRKGREARPFAVMFPAPAGKSLTNLERYADISGVPPARFMGEVRPIVILPAKGGTDLAPEVSMGLPWVGAYLPTTALHLRLLDLVGRPLVSTSGNPSGEPILTSVEDGRARLQCVADGLLLHDRPVLHGVDDSVVRYCAGTEVVLRRARGLAPLPVRAPFAIPAILGVGGHMKVALAVGMGDRVVVGPHVGDLESAPSIRAFRLQVKEFPRLLGAPVESVASDMHPSYTSTRWALDSGLPLYRVQHHHAHIAAVMAESGLGKEEEALGLAWDGTGWGSDGRVWGGEWLRCGYGTFERLGAFLPFPLLGGDKAALEPRRVALALTVMATDPGTARDNLDELFSSNELSMLLKNYEDKPIECTSVGRLFDGFGCLILGSTHNRYEGEVPMCIEAASSSTPTPFPPAAFLNVLSPGPGEPRFWVDWRPWVRFVLERKGEEPPEDLAAGFHEALADVGLEGLSKVKAEVGDLPVAAGGGCFQNARLIAGMRQRVPGILLARELPPNDGGLSYGQVLVAAAMSKT